VDAVKRSSVSDVEEERAILPATDVELRSLLRKICS